VKILLHKKVYTFQTKPEDELINWKAYRKGFAEALTHFLAAFLENLFCTHADNGC
jgi:hypothetical protein